MFLCEWVCENNPSVSVCVGGWLYRQHTLCLAISMLTCSLHLTMARYNRQSAQSVHNTTIFLDYTFFIKLSYIIIMYILIHPAVLHDTVN